MIVEILGLFSVVIGITAIVIYAKDRAIEKGKAQFK